MLNRLKNSLAAVALSTLIVLSLTTVAERTPAVADAGAAAMPVAALAELAAVDAERVAGQAAYAVAVKLAALAIDAALQQPGSAAKPQTSTPTQAGQTTQAARRDLRMPFYSFASRLARAQES